MTLSSIFLLLEGALFISARKNRQEVAAHIHAI